jgi:hypothetical protein
MMRIEFRLTMPGRSSWNGRWSGEARNYTIVREFEDGVAEEYDGRTWSYAWRDGWVASVAARVVGPGPLAKSDGFCGYDWMVASIVQHGEIYADHERPGAR